VRRLDDVVTRPVDPLALSLGVAAQEEKDHRISLDIDEVDDGVGEALPALAGVGPGVGGADGEDGVEEQEPLACPRRQVAVQRDRGAHVVVKLAEEVSQRRRRGDAGSHGEGEAVRLTGAVVGVLAEEDSAHGPERSEAEGIEDLADRGIDRGARVLGREESLELPEVQLLTLRLELLPAAGSPGEAATPGPRSYGRPPRATAAAGSGAGAVAGPTGSGTCPVSQVNNRSAALLRMM
jgi:hypothetical protein